MGFYVAPSKWEIQHAGQIFAGQQYAAAHGGELPDTRLWTMLEYRHSLNARRFDFYHPNVGRLLEQAGKAAPSTPAVDVLHDWRSIMRTSSESPVASTPPLSPPIPSYGSSSGQDVNPPVGPAAVPEPSAVVLLTLAMASTVLAAGFQRFRRRSR